MGIYKYIPFIITTSIAFIVFFFLWFQNERLTKENIELHSIIGKQNEAIQKQKIELESYVCDIETMKEYAVNEYKKAFNATKADKTCEGRLKHLESILKSYEE